ncbi:MAG TPA: tetratricopeptide repeat protein [Nitrososphaeraceae archaeon]|nr:tetratricopeptide repeat protein [Nitrososphaeraceae archaeon]
MGQTAEYIRDNIVKIVDENDNCVGTGFFIHKEYCVTCHHNIYGLDEIYVEREKYNNQTGQLRRRRNHAEWVEQFSDMQRDIAFLKVNRTNFKPLQYGRETYGKMPVVVRGFPEENTDQYPDGKDQSGTLSDIVATLPWKEEEAQQNGKKWNIKPKVNVQVYAFSASSAGTFELGFSGAPVYYEHDGTVLGMFEAIDSSKGYIIPIEEVIEKFDLEKEGKISSPSPALKTQKIMDMGNAYYNKREYAKAIEKYQLIISDPNYAFAFNNIGSALREIGKEEEAIQCYEKALEMIPNFAYAWNGKGLALDVLARYEEAIQCYEKALEIDPNYAPAWNNKGLTFEHLGRYEESIKYFDKALKIDPNNATAWNNKGYALDSLRKEEKAIKYFDKALEIDPNHAPAWNNKGYALLKLSRYEEAIQCHDKALEIDPNYAYAWKNKGNSLYLLGKYEEAIKYFDKALEIDPNNPYAWYIRSLVKAKKGNTEKSLVDLKKAIEIDKSIIHLIKQEKDFESIRNDRRFRALIMKRKMKLSRRKYN